MNDIIKIINSNQLLGIIIKSENISEGINFITDSNSSFQIACIHHQTGRIIEPHYHNTIERKITDTQEVIFIKKGKLAVNFYYDDRTLMVSHIVTDGDIVYLAAGGHGFEVLEETEMVEVKQGPYAGEKDKTRFVLK